MTPDPARQAAYEAARRVFLGKPGDKVRASNIDLVVDAVWDLAVEEGRRQSRALDPEVAEVVADTIERWEKR